MARRFMQAGAVLAMLGTGGCAVVSPLLDRDMSKAPNQACASPARPAAADTCFTLVAEDSAGARTPWTGGAVIPGRTLVAVFRGGTGCRGTFTHLTVTGSADGAGAAQLSVWDNIGRAGHGREIRWREGFAERILTLASISSATLIPAGARVAVTEGRLTPTSLCYRSY